VKNEEAKSKEIETARFSRGLKVWMESLYGTCWMLCWYAVGVRASTDAGLAPRRLLNSDRSNARNRMCYGPSVELSYLGSSVEQSVWLQDIRFTRLEVLL